MRFEFATAARVVFGPGVLREAGTLAAEIIKGRLRLRAFIVTNRAAADVRPLADALEAAEVSAVSFAVAGEPTTDLVRRAVQEAREQACDLTIGFGGGSAVDTAKAVAAMLTNPGDLTDYLEVIGGNRPLANPPGPWIAVPTTAGTGAEVTRNAVLASPEHQVKVSLRSPLMLPRLALVDPELALDLPPSVTASTGLDALTQLIEPFVSLRANPMTDALCREGIRLAAKALPRVFRDGRDIAARADMALASLFSGMALANAGLGAVHGFAGPIGGRFTAPHGAVCAALLPHVMAANVRALRAREPASPSSYRYAEVAALLTGVADAGADDGIEWVRSLCADFAIPPLRVYGVTDADLPLLVEQARAASSMKGNPIALTEAELQQILVAASG